MDRAHVDDASAFLLVHLPQRRSRGEERSIEMDRQKQLPLGKIEVDQRRDDLDSGIADQDVQRAERLDNLGGAGIHLAFVRHVHDDADGALAGRVELPGGGLGRLLVEIGNGDLRALADENGGDLLADAARRTGDDRDFVFQAHGSLLFQS